MSASAAAFVDLRALALDVGAGLPVVVDRDDLVEIASPRRDPKGVPIPLVHLRAGKGRTSFHVPMLYWAPDLAEALPEVLAARRSGKTCFAFGAAVGAAAGPLAELVRAVRRHCEATP